MAAAFPIVDEQALLQKSEKIWFSLKEEDWLEAFAQHPKIGDTKSLEGKFASTANWAAGEQAAVQQSTSEVIEQLAKCNKHYEDNFGYIFIVCATGKSAEEMLTLLKKRMGNDPKVEIKIAAAEQDKITKIRLQKLLSE